ncbi:hypothetical protein KKC_08152 [Listeria fleischmannii subsp. coloradonensis]|nr:hypothetical protein KKC_08152 [Listeria fleischmannii subsp. coloradonensis]STY34378.1 Uncharacterised protein [Listeria fleischmannii subsp. coloradonensis]
MLGSYLDCLTMDETVSEVKKIIVARKPTQHVVINAGKINLMKKMKRFVIL